MTKLDNVVCIGAGLLAGGLTALIADSNSKIDDATARGIVSGVSGLINAGFITLTAYIARNLFFYKNEIEDLGDELKITTVDKRNEEIIDCYFTFKNKCYINADSD